MFALAHSRRLGTRFAAAGLVATALVLGACSDDDDDGVSARVATTISVSGGNTQTGTVGAALGQPLIVTVRDQNGNLLPGQTVTFTTTSGGTFGATSVVTNAQGQAQTTFTLGNTAGAQTVIASVNGVTTPATFTFTGNAGTASQLAIVSGNEQTGTRGTALTQPFTVEARDQFGNPVQNATITWTTTAGTFAATPAATTDASGRATAALMLPATAGAVTVTARIGDNVASTVTFTATAL